MPNSLSFKTKQLEQMLLAVAGALLMLAVFGPDIAQPSHQHAFADARRWFSVPNAMDVLSNIAFAAGGVAGLCSVYSLLQRVRVTAKHALAALFFAGLVCTAAASTWYHLRPDDAGLGVDRLGMVLAFAGLLGLAVAGHISHRAGATTAGAVLLLGPLSIWVWLASGNVLPWLVIQFGGMGLILLMATLPRLSGALAVRWDVVIAVYAFAKLFEAADHEVYALTAEMVSGHSLKHLVASLAAWPVLAAIRSATAVAFEHSFAPLKKPGRIQSANIDTTAM